jgi:hypothetical protein
VDKVSILTLAAIIGTAGGSAYQLDSSGAETRALARDQVRFEKLSKKKRCIIQAWQAQTERRELDPRLDDECREFIEARSRHGSNTQR